MEQKQLIAMGIALQTKVLKACPLHNQIYLDDEANLDRAFALAVQLVRRRKPYVQQFGNDAHELTGLLSSLIGNAPESCPDCKMPREHGMNDIDTAAAPLTSMARRSALEVVR
ncbi:MAG: hypothetical protein M3N50_13635 [Pseudomonadota bacterium]|nr:hypothetical protein [Pseudomonadota bacterium]